MAKRVRLAFEPKGIMLPIDKLLPLRPGGKGTKAGPVARRIKASIKELGVIEPFIVHRKPGKDSPYTLLEGNFRLAILRELGIKEVFCLIATDDEAYTYNSKVNRLTPIQEHFMILKAIQMSVSEERIAAALDLNVSLIRQKRDLLHGVCKEAVTLLKGRRASAGALRELKKAKPMKQIEMAEMMIMVNNFSTAYAKCLLATAQPDELVDPQQTKSIPGMTPDNIARIERELEDVVKDYAKREETYGKAMLNLVVAGAYLRKLLGSAAVVRFLSQRHADILSEFEKISETTDMESVDEPLEVKNGR